MGYLRLPYTLSVSSSIETATVVFHNMISTQHPHPPPLRPCYCNVYCHLLSHSYKHNNHQTVNIKQTPSTTLAVVLVFFMSPISASSIRPCLFVWSWRDSPQWASASSFTRFLDHTQRSITVGRTPLDEWSARRRYLYLTTHNTHNRQTSMPPVGFEPSLSGRAAADLRLRLRGRPLGLASIRPYYTHFRMKTSPPSQCSLWTSNNVLCELQTQLSVQNSITIYNLRQSLHGVLCYSVVRSVIQQLPMWSVVRYYACNVLR